MRRRPSPRSRSRDPTPPKPKPKPPPPAVHAPPMDDLHLHPGSGRRPARCAKMRRPHRPIISAVGLRQRPPYHLSATGPAAATARAGGSGGGSRDRRGEELGDASWGDPDGALGDTTRGRFFSVVRLYLDGTYLLLPKRYRNNLARFFSSRASPFINSLQKAIREDGKE